MGRSNSKKLCDEFGLVNIFHRKHPNHKKFKTYQEGSRFIDYGLIHRDLIQEIEIVTYEPFGYRKGKGDHRGWYFDIRERRMFGNQIEKVYQSEGRNLHSKDSKQLPVYLQAVDKVMAKRNVYKRIVKIMKSKKKRYHKEAEAIDRDITAATQHGEQQCEKRHMDFWDFEVHILKMKRALWRYLLKRRKRHLDTTVICAAAKLRASICSTHQHQRQSRMWRRYKKT